MAKIDLSNPVDSLNSFIRARVSATPEEVVFWFAGNVYSFVEGERSRHLFQFEGYNIGRSRKVEGGWQMLTKECVFYKDPVTGEILEEWNNPWTGETVQVVHVLNDPVNQHLMLESPRGPWQLPYTELGDDVYFSTDVFLKYPSPLPQSKYP
ncbi:MAG: DUF1838 domain-containing protein, partial [Dehalococcoidia bacterium]|nr:DUF1838 domain-containing protein [Dehalococcoidia bacterium]